MSSSCLLWGVTLLYALLPQAKLKSFSAKIVQLLKEWTEAFPYDFQDEKAMAELKAITHRVTQCDEVRSSLDSGRSSWVYDWGRGFTLTEGWVFRDSSVCGLLCCHCSKMTAGWLYLCPSSQDVLVSAVRT